ncbi:MAG: transposase [Clostridia bacterium]
MAKGVSNNEEFKKTIVKLLETGKKASEIASEYDLNVKNVYNWQKKYGTIIGSDGTVTNNKEIADLIKKNKQLQEEVDILKKAMVIFTKK